MEVISHLPPIKQAPATQNKELGFLVDAFAGFIAASTRLEGSYAQLQEQVSHLSRELADRNAALKISLAENERVHRALQQIVDSMPCGVLVVEGDGSVSMMNPEGRRLLNLDRSPAEHLDAISIAAGVDLSGFLRRRTGADQEQEFCTSTAAGKRWLAVQERCLFQGNELGFHGRRQTILILRDITLHKQAELEREHARKATALSEVAMTLAHEIRNPLASLELFTGLIAAGSGENTAEWVSHLHAGIRSLAGTVNNVLSFHGAGSASLSPIDLIASIRGSVEFARPIADQAGVSLVFESEDSGLWVQGNSSALQQVVLNIVSNSLRHTDPEGCVAVIVRRGGGSKNENQGIGIIEFRDTGCGIAAKDIHDIFRAGFSVRGSSSGLGLAVCSQIVKQHKGSIRAVSTVGVGTTFFVEIPAL